MKILQIANKSPYPANDGSSIAIYNMAKGLMACNVDLHLLVINTKKHFKSDDQIPKEFKENCNYISVYKNTNTSYLGAFINLFSNKSYFVSRFYFKSFRTKLIEVLKTNTYDIIQLEGLFMSTYIDIIKKNTNAKIVLRAHNIEHFIWKKHLNYSTNFIKKYYLVIQNKRLKKFELSVLKKIDAIVSISKVDEKDFKILGFTKLIYTCITGVDLKEYQYKNISKQKNNTVFYIGSMDWIPNQEAVKWFLNNCWKSILDEVVDAKFVIAGSGIPLEFFQINLPNITILENVIDNKVFFDQHQIMVVPLLSGSGLRIKIIEGMSYGKAIVSTSIGAEGINYKHAENILIADDSSQFSKHVIMLLKDNNLKDKLSKNAAIFASKEFDNLKLISSLKEFYINLIHD